MTKFNLKTLAVAVALAAAAGQANAAMVNAQGTLSDGNSSVVMYAWSQSLGRSYTRDLGFKLNDFLYNGAIAPTAGSLPFNPAATPAVSAGNVTTAGYSLSFGTDALMTSWLGNGSAFASDVQWGVAAVDGVGTGSAVRALTTVAPGASSAGTINAELYTFEVKFDTVMAMHNPLGTHATSLNGSAGTDGTMVLAAQDVPAQIGLNWGGATSFFATAGAGQSLEMFFMAGNGTLGSNNATAVRYGASNPDGTAKWTLAANGGLTYAVPSAVPIPAAVWLFASGLMGLVGISRRKKSV